MSTQPKGVFESKTIIGVLVMLIASAIQAIGIDAHIDEGMIVDMLTQLAELGGAALAIYGRFKAEQPIKLGGALKSDDSNNESGV